MVSHTEHVNSFSSTRLPLLLLLVPSAMMACASVGQVASAGIIVDTLSSPQFGGAASVTKALVAPCSRALAMVSCHTSAQLRAKCDRYIGCYYHKRQVRSFARVYSVMY